MATKKRKTIAQVEKELSSAKRLGRNAANRLKAFKEGAIWAQNMAKEARRD